MLALPLLLVQCERAKTKAPVPLVVGAKRKTFIPGRFLFPVLFEQFPLTVRLQPNICALSLRPVESSQGAPFLFQNTQTP